MAFSTPSLDRTAKKRSVPWNADNIMEAVFQARKFSDFSGVFQSNFCFFLVGNGRKSPV
jgi:hypothetical protein